MDTGKVQEQRILGTLVNKDASGILGYAEQIYDTEAGKSIVENTISAEAIKQSATVMDDETGSEGAGA